MVKYSYRRKERLNMKKAFKPIMLPLPSDVLDYSVFLNELLDATSKLEVYKEKIKDSKLDSSWFMPTLQQKEAVASTKLEGTQTTLDGVLINQIEPDVNNQDMNEVSNYFYASILGLRMLRNAGFSDDFLCTIHKSLLSGNVRKRESTLVGEYRKTQNYIGLTNGSHDITYIPPTPESVPKCMNNLISYINDPKDNLQPLIRIAIIHAQMETIHPFDDGNGRVGRILIPLYLYEKEQISLPCFFISEALESDKFKYYRLLDGTREKGNWNDWIKFFLQTVAKQCEKYIYIVEKINQLYDEHLATAKSLISNNAVVDIINTIYKQPILTTATFEKETGLPLTTLNRYINILIKNGLLDTDGKKRNRTFFCYELLDVLKL